MEPLVVGCVELVGLPEWGIRRLRAKVDTGARTSALHVLNAVEDGDGWVRFDVPLMRGGRPELVPVRALLSRRTRVKPTTGQGRERLFVRTTLRLGPVEREIEVGLVRRDGMLYRMLLGRKAIAPGFLVDPGGRFRLTKRPKKKHRRLLPSGGPP